MGNWHCIPSSCATVHYREYQGAKIRWRYPGEGWQEIVGANDYSTEVVQNLTQNTAYQLVYREATIRNNAFQEWNPNEILASLGTYNGIQSWQLKVVWKQNTFYQNPFSPWLAESSPSISNRSAIFSLDITTQGVVINKSLFSSFGIWALRVQQTNAALRSTSCVFKVFKQGQVVHQETRSVCPEIQKISCQLSAVDKQIEIKKLPFLEKVEVVPYQYSAYKLPGIGTPVAQADPIPSQCLNIYNNAIYVIPPPENAVKYPNATPFDSFVAQICSAPGCPPPEYDVICDCNNCESCPNGTCPVECDGQVCCYDPTTGKAIKTIAVANYCGGIS